MSKFNVGDKVRIKEDLSKCEFGYCGYMEEFAGKETTVISTFGKGVIKLDIDEQVWDWSENVLELIEEGKTMKMKRIDYILNAKDNMQVILDETVLDCDICPVDSGVCNGDCEFYYKEYLNEEIEVDKSKLKDADVESITIGQALQSIYDIPPQIKINSDKIKEVEDVVNHPSHYTDGNIEVMDFIEDKQLNFARGNVIKYVSRAGKKDPNKELEDLQKGFWYLNREIERLKKLQDKNK